jgi:serine/threonine-protein kinase
MATGIDHERVLQLVEEVLDSGRAPEEVCADSPGMLAAVRARLENCRRLDVVLGELFPRQSHPMTGRRGGRGGAAMVGEVAALPSIPGYAVEAVLGRGGMGVVYRARHLGLRRPVALKMLLSGAYAGRVERARFLREARAVAALRHAHVVQVHDVGEHEGRPYFTMELMEGGSLADRLGGVPWPALRAAALVEAISGAVEAAHRVGIVHRDLKPANVLLGADGTPKVSDFGLAHQAGADEEMSLTLSGARLGTPSYMAPEQAAGRSGAVGAWTDVYALGAVLYEALTGRPPFRGASAAETERQVITQEPVSPSRLNAGVPRDLETICLKCLRKEPERRYGSAAELAADLGRFRDGRPILARPPSVAGRVWRWGRREPAKAALAVTAMVMGGVAVGAGSWVERQREFARAEDARREGRASQAAETVIEQAAALEEQGRWPGARAVLAAPSLAGAPPATAERLRRARADADMGARLEDVRLRLSEGPQVQERASPLADRLYAEAFRAYGVSLGDPVEVAAARVRDSAIAPTVLVFLHDWFYWVTDENRAALRALIERADDDPWRREFRDALTANDVRRLVGLARDPGAARQPPVILSGLVGTLLTSGQADVRDAAWAMLRGAQRRNPGDFWINYLLGAMLKGERPQEAVGYLRAAVAIRPGSSQAHVLLGRLLRETGDLDGAVDALRKVVDQSPADADVGELARALAPSGRLEEARAAWEKVLAGNPPEYDAWYGYAQLCMYLGDEPAYRRARAALLDRFADRPANSTVAERTSLACLLRPADGEELRRTVALARRAAALDDKLPGPESPYVQFVTGLAEYRQGHADRAIPVLRAAAARLPNRAGPRLALAMAQFRTGAVRDARASLALAVRGYDWTPAKASHTTVWVSHVLRREAESLILPDLPSFFRGEYEPRDNDERLALVGACQSRESYRAAARLFEQAFGADPGLADELTAQCLDRAAGEGGADRGEALGTDPRYVAARCAALAGCGRGSDAAGSGEPERAHWRERAREWLRADLAALLELRRRDPRRASALVDVALALWLAAPELAPLREPVALEEFPVSEREGWAALWSDVGLALRGIR